MRKLQQSFSRNEFKIGIFLFLLTVVLLFYFYGRNNILASLSLGLTWIGSSLIFDFLLRKRTGKSILYLALSSWQNFLKVAVVSVLCAFLLDIFGLYLTRLWYYPFVPSSLYFVLSPLLYFFYTLVLFIIYEFVKNQSNKFVKAGRTSKYIKMIYPNLMKLMFVFGIISFTACVLYGLKNITHFAMPFYEVNVDSGIAIPTWFIVLVLPSIFFIVEYFCYLENKETLIYSLLRKDFVPIFAIVVAVLIGIALMELLNAPFQVWVYANGPFNDSKLLGVPIWVWVVWPTQFLMFLSIFRLVLEEKQVDIW